MEARVDSRYVGIRWGNGSGITLHNEGRSLVLIPGNDGYCKDCLKLGEMLQSHLSCLMLHHSLAFTKRVVDPKEGLRQKSRVSGRSRNILVLVVQESIVSFSSYTKYSYPDLSGGTSDKVSGSIESSIQVFT